MPPVRSQIDRALQQGSLDIDFPPGEFTSVGATIVRATRVYCAALPFLAAVTLIAHLPAKLLLQAVCYAFDVPMDGVLGYCLMDLCDLVVSALAIPAIVYGLMAQFSRGKLPSIGEALRWGRRQWGRTLWNKIKVEITITLWSLMLLAPGIVAAIKLIFTDAIVAIEGDREPEPLRRSRAVSEGHRWRIVAALLPAVPLSAIHMYAELRTVQAAPLTMVPVDVLGAVLDQWTTVATVLIYLGLTSTLRPAIGKRKAA